MCHYWINFLTSSGPLLITPLRNVYIYHWFHFCVTAITVAIEV